MIDYKEEISELELRYELSTERIKEIPDDVERIRRTASYKKHVSETGYDYLDFFDVKSAYINYVLSKYDMFDDQASQKKCSPEEMEAVNKKLYEDILGDNYASSYSNPDYAEAKLGVMGKAFGFISAELQGLPAYAADKKKLHIVALLELFLEVYSMFFMGLDQDENKDEYEPPFVKDVEKAIYYYAFDYIEYFVYDRLSDSFVPGDSLAYDIVMNSDLGDIAYLYRYGEYISEDEIKLSQYLSGLSEEQIDSVAFTYTDGFRRGFDVMGIKFEGKNSVCIRYHIGQERIVRAAIKNFEEMGLRPILMRYSVNRTMRRGTVKQGYEGTSPNMQFEFDHRNDDALFMDSRFSDRRIKSTENAQKELMDYIPGYAGPAVIETFGEELFSPEVKESACSYTKEQQTMVTAMYGKLGQLSNKVLPGDSYSFTIIAFPMPAIGDDFEAIFDETVAINSLDNDKYIRIQQSLIDTLDKSDYVRVEGANGNRTDIKVKLRRLDNPDKETQFENCTADVNIPLGEVFTSPVLKETEGTLHVSGTYLNGYFFKDIELQFKDGVVTDYLCRNFDEDSISEEDSRERGRKYIKENILFNHDFLPLGEFAIGTNTLAYSMARKYNILSKLPILIVEKTGPHFAVGDTCYSHAEDHAVFNPDGKEIISRENDFSLLRDTEPDKAYFNCHTDITIPYNELGRLYTVDSEGKETDIIVNGRFVLPGTEALNEALD